MPELPEVETIRRSLSPLLIGKTISSVEVRSQKQFIGNPASCIGQTITRIHRKGKVFVVELNNDFYLSVHLKMSGQLLFKKASTPSTRIVFQFSDGTWLLFNDMRKFGWIKLSREQAVPKGHDVLTEEFTQEYFALVVGKTRKPIKTVLMDQELIAGVGNIYANDALYLAQIHPQRSSASLKSDEVAKLYDSVLTVIREGVERRGSSRENGIYRLPDGTKGSYQKYFKVYAKEGKECPRCKTQIKRIVIAGRSSFYCPHCQAAPG